VGSINVHRDRLDGHNNDVDDIESIFYNSTNRDVVKRRRLDTYSYESGEDDDEDDNELFYPEDDPYLQVDLAKVLAPIQQPLEIARRDAISKTYKSEVLRHLSQQAIEIIEKEQDTVIQLSSLLDIFLCEDTSQLLELKLQLPVYDHGFNGSVNEQGASSQENDEDIDLDKRITRRKSMQDSSDPFFALPMIQMDPDFGLNQEDAEEARQLSQIALQRNEEFIRNLSNLRNGLSRAQYVKEKLFSWAKELNGDPDESDIYQKETSAPASANNNISNGKGNLSSFNISGVSGSKDDEPSKDDNGTPAPSTSTSNTSAASNNGPGRRTSGRRGGRPALS
jgi:hypothetical protein